MPETTKHLTWTKHTFTCQDCKQLCYASQEEIDEARKDCGYGPELTDAEVAAEFDFCLSCVNGKLIPGEKVALQPLRVFVHEATELGWAKWDSRECDITECFPNDVDEAIRVRAELEQTGFAWIGGGASQLYLLTRKPGQLGDRPAEPIQCPVCGGVNEGNTCCPPPEPISAPATLRAICPDCGNPVAEAGWTCGECGGDDDDDVDDGDYIAERVAERDDIPPTPFD